MCQERIKDWDGDDPICSFRSGVFSAEGWNCALMDVFRDMADTKGIVTHIDDQSYALISIKGVCLFLSWYKRRGSTDQFLIMNMEPRRPYESELLELISHKETA